jgi:lipopolysaccharide exporter
MARLLTPADYGLVGMCAFFLGFASIFRDFGMSAAVIQQKRVEEPLPSTAFWLNIIFGSATCLVGVLGAPLVSEFYHTPSLTSIMRVLSVSFILSSVGSVPNSLLSRTMAFRKIAITEITAGVASAGVGISCAWSGLGVWSLVAANLTGAATEALAYTLQSRWHPKWKFDFAQIRLIFGFSANLSGFQILNYFARNADNMLLGRYVGAAALGYYQYAYNLMLYPLQHVSGALGRVLFPAFSQVQDDNERFRSAYMRLCSVIAALTFPMTLGMLSVAGPLIDVLLGPKWHPAARLLMILAPVGLVQSIVTTAGYIYMAKGRTDWMFRMGLITSPLLVASFVVGLPWGTEGVAISYAVCVYAVTPPALVIPFRLIDLSFREFVKRLMPTLGYSLVMLLATIATRIGLERIGLRPPATLAVCVATGVIVYVGLVVWRKPPFLHDLALLAGHRLPAPVRMWLARHDPEQR